MATEAGQLPINGHYNTQASYGVPDAYGGPVQHPGQAPTATTPSQTPSSQHTAASSTSTANAEASNEISKDEVGWYFVEQYYTTMSRSPEKLHLFYSKRSQFVCGIEAEKVSVSVGQKAISDRIKGLEIQECKVRVLNVDSQASFQNIVVQVIGEMSNKAAPHRKFVQTFVLAEQPNGYFVLNDIFRYLQEDEEVEVEEQEQAAVPQAPEEKVEAQEEAEVPSAKSSESLGDQGATEAVDAKLEEVAKQETAEPEAPVEIPSTNGPVEEAEESTTTVEETVPTVDATEESKEAKIEVEKPKDPEPTPAVSPPKPATPTPAQDAPAPGPAPKAAPKTWASMVAANKAPSPAVPAVPAPQQAAPSQKPATPTAQPQTPPVSTSENTQAPNATGNGWQMAGDHGKKQSRTQTSDQGPVLAYIKNVNERVDASLLKQTLLKYGKLAYFDVSRPKNCAFVEFESPQGYAAAVAANPHQIGSEAINVEERRPRAGAFGSGANYGARGGSLGRGGRGGLDGRTPSQGRGGFQQNKDARGGYAQRGARGGSGNVTPKGRGTAQAA